jgi:transcription antitermination factor NusG
MVDGTGDVCPLRMGNLTRIMTGQIEGYEARVIGVDSARREVCLSLTVFERPVAIRLDFRTAADILELVQKPTD